MNYFKHSKIKIFMINLDLEKAYDKLEWSFIYRALIYFKFPLKLSKLIMSCIITSSMAILVNESKTNFFNPSRGIWQGDPLSPYIFILYMEMLSNYINYQVDIGLWTPIKLTSRSPLISHIFYTDDLTYSYGQGKF